MAPASKIVASDLAEQMFGFASKVATGEMSQAELDANGREEWPLHYAIADALGGTVQPFDQYQGPYISVGGDLRVGEGPYAAAPQLPGVVRLWISTDDGVEGIVYNEENEKQSSPFPLNGPGSETAAISAAEEVLDAQGNLALEGSDKEAGLPDALPILGHLNSPLEGKSAHWVKTADGSMLSREDTLPSENMKLQRTIGDPLDQPISTFSQFYPNVGSMQMPNPLSPIEGDSGFFTYMIPGAVFQSHDGQQWVVDNYNAGAYGVELYNRWYPRLRAFVNLDDVRRSIHSWVEPVQIVVPPPPPGVSYVGQPVRVVGGKPLRA